MLPHSSEEIEAARAVAQKHQNESQEAYREAEEMKTNGQFGPALAAARVRHSESSKAFFLASEKVRKMNEEQAAAIEAEQKKAEKAHRKAQLNSWAKPHLEKVQEAGVKVDKALIALVAAIKALREAQAIAVQNCPDSTSSHFLRGNSYILPVLYRKLSGVIHAPDNRLVDDATLATVTQHLPTEVSA